MRSHVAPVPFNTWKPPCEGLRQILHAFLQLSTKTQTTFDHHHTNKRVRVPAPIWKKIRHLCIWSAHNCNTTRHTYFTYQTCLSASGPVVVIERRRARRTQAQDQPKAALSNGENCLHMLGGTMCDERHHVRSVIERTYVHWRQSRHSENNPAWT